MPDEVKYNHQLCYLLAYPRWEIEHGLAIIIRDGKFAHFDDHGLYLAEYDV